MKKLIILALLLSCNVSAVTLEQYDAMSFKEKCTLDNFPSPETVDQWVAEKLEGKTDAANIRMVQRQYYESVARVCISTLTLENMRLEYKLKYGKEPDAR